MKNSRLFQRVTFTGVNTWSSNILRLSYRHDGEKGKTMSEFCKQCAEELGFNTDFAGLVTEAEVKEGYSMPVLCEGCGPCFVDHQGKCLKGTLCYHYDSH